MFYKQLFINLLNIFISILIKTNSQAIFLKKASYSRIVKQKISRNTFYELIS